jgi:hypothetical protein
MISKYLKISQDIEIYKGLMKVVITYIKDLIIAMGIWIGIFIFLGMVIFFVCSIFLSLQALLFFPPSIFLYLLIFFALIEEPWKNKGGQIK